MVLNKLAGRRWPALLVALVALVAVALMLGPTSRAPEARAAAPSNVHAAVLDPANQVNGFVSVIIQSSGDTSATAEAVTAVGGSVSQQYHIIPAVQATIPVDQVDALASNPAVKTISLNSNMETTGLGNFGRSNWRTLIDPTATPTPSSTPATGQTTWGRGTSPLGGSTFGNATPTTPTPGGPTPSPTAHPDRYSILGPYLPDGHKRGRYTDVVSVFPQVVGATDVWDEGITGKGIGVAVVDTGVSHNVGSDFGNRVIARFSPGDAALRQDNNDPYGHGTHTAGVIAGNGRDSQGRYMGIAPDANIIDVQVGTYSKGMKLGDVIAGLQYVLDHKAQYNIRVANLSFTQSTPESFFTSPLDAAVEQLWFHGIVVVSSEGNLGTSNAYVTDHPPANDPYVISVGGFSDNATLQTADDTLASWSTYGTTHDGFQKPDIIAPGWHIIATTGNAPSILYMQNPRLRVGTHYLKLSGTSESAPIVSGTVALMLQHNPSLTPDQVKAQLVGTADAFPGSNAPALNAYDAVFGPSHGLANQGLPKSLWIGANGSIQNTPASPSSITWDAITWDSITWDAITWDSITWDSITWDSITWDAITWDAITWDAITWD